MQIMLRQVDADGECRLIRNLIKSIDYKLLLNLKTMEHLLL